VPGRHDAAYRNFGVFLATLSNPLFDECDAYHAPLYLPQDAVIKSITAYFYVPGEMGAGRFESSCGDVGLVLVRYRPASMQHPFDRLAEAVPVGPAAAQADVSAHALVSTNAVVDNTVYGYFLDLRLPHFTPPEVYHESGVVFMGAQVRYESVGPY